MKKHLRLAMKKSSVYSVYRDIMAVNNFNSRFAVSPKNPNGFGKAGTVARVSVSVTIPGYQSMDYTRVPVRYTANGNVKAQTIGRY